MQVCVYLVHMFREVINSKDTQQRAAQTHDPRQHVNEEPEQTLKNRKRQLLTVHLRHQLLHTRHNVNTSHLSFIPSHTRWCSYFELCADVLTLESNCTFLAHFKIPGAENLDGQQSFRFIDAKTLTEGL